MNINTEFGNKVKELRIKYNMTQEDLAFKANLDRSYIPSIENGKRNVSLQTIEKLAKAFEIDISVFFNNII